MNSSVGFLRRSSVKYEETEVSDIRSELLPSNNVVFVYCSKM